MLVAWRRANVRKPDRKRTITIIESPAVRDWLTVVIRENWGPFDSTNGVRMSLACPEERFTCTSPEIRFSVGTGTSQITPLLKLTLVSEFGKI